MIISYYYYLSKHIQADCFFVSSMLNYILTFLLACCWTALINSFFHTNQFRRTSSQKHMTIRKTSDFGVQMTTATIDDESKIAASEKLLLNDNVAIIGGGPAGLSTAIMLARRGYSNIRVYERLSEPPAPDDPSWRIVDSERTYNIGISGRGQSVLRAIEAMTVLDAHSTSVVGRQYWEPDTPPASPLELTWANRSYVTKCIPRDCLAACLISEIKSKYNSQIQLHFNIACDKIDWPSVEETNQMCMLSMKSTITNSVFWTEKAGWVVGTDGFQSSVRTSMVTSPSEQPVSFKLFKDTNVRVYRTIPLYFNSTDGRKKWRGDVNYSVRTKLDINLDALPLKDGPYLGVILYRPWDERITGLKTGKDSRAFFDQVFPMFSSVIRDEDCEVFATKRDSKLPVFSYAGPSIHKSGFGCLLGDTIHTVKPYFGLGLNSALEDVMSLENALNKHKDDLSKALPSYSRDRAKQAKAMVKMSKTLDGGIFSFIIPLVIDSILSKKLPFIFAPNTITLLQNEKLSFTQVLWRKRLDRVMQFGLFSLIAVAVRQLALMLLYSLKLLLRTKIKIVV